ncbi:MAG: hypothetical protein IT178_16375 [Acidobacteria bacterium]|nr:hypothetical protein [Acidobacteriota bacterium]
MDQTLINIAFTLAGGLGSFVLKATWDALNLLRKDLAELQKSISTQYVRREDFRDHAQDIKEMLVRIEAKLDSKQDKP